MTAEPLGQAAAACHQRAVASTEQALRELDHEAAPVSFQSVARRAGVSRQWLYTQPALRSQIDDCASARALSPTTFPPANSRPRLPCASAWRRCARRTSVCAKRTPASRPSSLLPRRA